MIRFFRSRVLSKHKAFFASAIITLVYFLAAAFWIVESDRIAVALFRDPRILASIQTYKGLGFIVVTSIVLFTTLIVFFSRFVQADNELERRESQYRTLVENSSDFVVRFDRGLRQLFVSRSLARATGIAVEDSVGKTNEELGMPPELVTQWNDALRVVFKSGKGQSLEFSFVVDSVNRHYHSRLTPELDETA